MEQKQLNFAIRFQAFLLRCCRLEKLETDDWNTHTQTGWNTRRNGDDGDRSYRCLNFSLLIYEQLHMVLTLG
ncbi:hypothetical protein DPX16_10017 [Anabarilius grahami]|uniref:Uncharacterized protein n=1 Tax=Anabarilius grahami TaxID=495550 RepID=A0A3N0XWS1_ANAGA|nr:hypothetical protein DPX16_10017 [Anabarilius grahami]